MEAKQVKITVISATGLKNVRTSKFLHPKVYVKVLVPNNHPQKTPVDENGGTNPVWNFPMNFQLYDPTPQGDHNSIVFNLHSRTTHRSKYVGKVIVPIDTLFDTKQKECDSARVVSYPVSGDGFTGTLMFSYWIGSSSGSTMDVEVQSAGCQNHQQGSSSESKLNTIMSVKQVKITVISATDLKNVRTFKFRHPKVYVTVLVPNNLPQKTPVDEIGGTNPVWNFPMNFQLYDSTLQGDHNSIVFNLYSRTTHRSKYVGQVIVPIDTLSDTKQKESDSARMVSYPVCGDGFTGTLMFSYWIGSSSGSTADGEAHSAGSQNHRQGSSSKLNTMFEGMSAAASVASVVVAATVGNN